MFNGWPLASATEMEREGKDAGKNHSKKRRGCKGLPKNGTKTATAIVERTRAVRITRDHERYSAESGLCGSSSSKLCATGVIVNAYLVKGLTTYRGQPHCMHTFLREWWTQADGRVWMKWKWKNVEGLLWCTVVQTAILEATNFPGRLRVICDAVSSPNMVKPIAAMPP